MSEKTAEALFLKYKKQLIKELKRKALTNTEIDILCKKELGKKYKGCFSQDQKFPLTSGYYILNNDISTGKGIHWVGVILTSKTAYVFDSFARDPKKLLSHFTKRLVSKKIKIISSDRKDKEQGDLEVICGHLSIAWLMTCQQLGIRSAIKI